MFAKAKIKPCEWLYFALLLCVAFTQLVSKVLTETGGFTSRYSAFFAIGLLFAAHVGNRYNKALLYRWCWLSIFWILSVTDAVAILFAAYLLIVNGTEALLNAGVLCAVAVLLIPGLWQLYRYVWVNASIWKTG